VSGGRRELGITLRAAMRMRAKVKCLLPNIWTPRGRRVWIVYSLKLGLAPIQREYVCYCLSAALRAASRRDMRLIRPLLCTLYIHG